MAIMKCRICLNAQNNIAYQVKEMYWGTADQFSYFECAQCGCLQILDIPRDIDKFYKRSYYSFVNNPDWQRGFGRWFFNKIKGIPAFPLAAYNLALDKNTKVLDVGCGNGGLLYSLREHGMKYLWGIDTYIEKEIRYKNGVVVYKMPLDEFVGLNNKMDLIMFNHSFEHMLDSASVLSCCRQILRPGGKMLIRIPTTSSEAWRHYRESWVGLMAPFHFIIHSRKSLGMAADQSGFQVDRIQCESNEFQFWGSEQIKQGISIMAENSYEVDRVKSIFTQDQIAEFRNRSIALNKIDDGDWIAVVLK
jgi:SAM-dependent methyltransferase